MQELVESVPACWPQIEESFAWTARVEEDVIGPPGCGKTSFLLNAVRDTARAYGADRIMVVSLTKSAIRTVVGRILGGKVDLDLEMVGTLHSMGFRALGVRLEQMTTAHWDEWNTDFAAKFPQFHLSTPKWNAGQLDVDVPEDPLLDEGDALHNLMNILRAQRTPREDWPPDVHRFARLWDRWKLQNDYFDFTDLLEIPYHDVDHAPGDPLAIFADEVQDFTPLGLLLLRKWGANAMKLVLVGDEDQALYTFAGSLPGALVNPYAHRVRVLEQSYRVPRRVKDAAIKIISRVPNRREVTYYARREGGDPDAPEVEGKVYRLDDATIRDPTLAIRVIERTLDKGKDAMIMTTCGYMLNTIIAELKAQGIPFHNPYRRSQINWNPLFRDPERSGVAGVDRLLAYLRPNPTAWDTEARWWTVGELEIWIDLLKSSAFMDKDDKRRVLDYLDDIPNEHEILEPDFLLTFLAEEDYDAIMQGDLGWLEERMLAKYAKSLAYPLTIIKKRGMRTLWEAVETKAGPRVVVGTGHSLKGTGAHTVLVFPDLSAAGYREWENPATQAPLRRLVYVMFTRTVEELYLCGPSSARAIGW